ncbi:MAG: 50S ribosomal protein L35 [Alphaproteobacteria bacterium]
MPKLKTKSGAKKRFRTTASGRVRSGGAGLRHNLRKRSQRRKRQGRGTKVLTASDGKRIKRHFLPYG